MTFDSKLPPFWSSSIQQTWVSEGCTCSKHARYIQIRLQTNALVGRLVLTHSCALGSFSIAFWHGWWLIAKYLQYLDQFRAQLAFGELTL